jgi:MFS family permease
MERVLDYGPLEIGLAFLPVAVAIGTLSLGMSARLTTRFGARRVLLPALALIGTGLVLLARVPTDATYLTDLLPSMLLMGIGAGLGFPALMTLAMSGATQSDSGLASGLVNTAQQVGGALGLAVLTTLATSRADSLIADGDSSAAALTSGYQLAWWIGAGLVVAAIGIALAVLPRDARAGRDVTVSEPVELEEARSEAA